MSVKRVTVQRWVCDDGTEWKTRKKARAHAKWMADDLKEGREMWGLLERRAKKPSSVFIQPVVYK